MSCDNQCGCSNKGHFEQDILEFVMIATHLGWTDEHSHLLGEFEKDQIDWDGGGHLVKEKHCARLRGYLHAAEQTEMQIKQWIRRLEGWAKSKQISVTVRDTSIGPKTQIVDGQGRVIGEQG